MPTETTTPATPDAKTLDGMLRDAWVSAKLSRVRSSDSTMESSWKRVFSAQFDAKVSESAKYGLTGSAFTAAENAAVPLRYAAALAWDHHTFAHSAGNAPKKLTPAYTQYLLREAQRGNELALSVVKARNVR